MRINTTQLNQLLATVGPYDTQEQGWRLSMQDLLAIDLRDERAMLTRIADAISCVNDLEQHDPERLVHTLLLQLRDERKKARALEQDLDCDRKMDEAIHAICHQAIGRTDSHSTQEAVERMAARITTLEAELAAAKKDTERLNHAIAIWSNAHYNTVWRSALHQRIRQECVDDLKVAIESVKEETK